MELLLQQDKPQQAVVSKLRPNSYFLFYRKRRFYIRLAGKKNKASSSKKERKKELEMKTKK